MLLVHPGTAEDGRAFFATHWPRARAIADEDGAFYRAFVLGRGGLREFFGLRVWKQGWRAFRKGHRAGRPVGDPRLMPGTFLVAGERVLAEHRAATAGDHADYHELARLARDASTP